MKNLQRVDRLLSVKEIKANPRNARTHSKAQIRQIADSIKACGFGAPVLVDETVTLIAGHGRFKAGRMSELRSHPTVKPIALVADAMRDCTRRRDAVLDTFSGSGTTIMAAERIGRRAFAMDVEPRSSSPLAGVQRQRRRRRGKRPDLRRTRDAGR